jgi:hypothetical protein
MLENRSGEGLLLRAEPMGLAEEIVRMMVDLRVADGALLLDADPTWAGAINTVLIKKGVRVSELAGVSRYSAAAQPSHNLAGFTHSEEKGVSRRWSWRKHVPHNNDLLRGSS